MLKYILLDIIYFISPFSGIRLFYFNVKGIINKLCVYIYRVLHDSFHCLSFGENICERGKQKVDVSAELRRIMSDWK